METMNFDTNKSKRAEKIRRDRREKNDSRSFLAFKRPKPQKNIRIEDMLDEDWTAVE